MKIVVLNEEKMNYDHLLDFHQLGDDVDVYAYSSDEEILERVRGATIVITKELVLSNEMVEAFDDSIKLIIEAGTGYNNIPLATCQKKGIMVCNIPAYSSQRVAQTAIMLMLNLASSMQVQLRMLERKDHSNFTKYLQVSHVELNDKVLGVVGYGHIAKETIKIAMAMGMKIVVASRTPRQDHDGIHFTTLDELLKMSDVVSLHCPLNEQTYMSLLWIIALFMIWTMSLSLHIWAGKAKKQEKDSIKSLKVMWIIILQVIQSMLSTGHLAKRCLFKIGR